MVKLPRNPVVIANFVLVPIVLLFAMYARAIPIRHAPKRLDNKTPDEKSLFIGLKRTFR